MMHIPILFSFARSGGTLVNQLLGTHPDCLILSEVNPAASVVAVAAQASDWMALIGPGEIEQFEALSYSQQVARLDELARSKNKMLVVRDWVTVNYLLGAGGHEIVPSGILEQSFYLTHAGYSLRPLVVTRKAAAVYQSLRQNFPQLAGLSAEDFASSYLAYAHAVSTFPRVSLEALQTAPRETLLRILQTLALSTGHVDNQLETFANFQRCTGNNTLGKPAATTHSRRIVPVSCKPAAGTDFAEIPAFAEADRLMGYEP
jgi:hypothetical protein